MRAPRLAFCLLLPALLGGVPATRAAAQHITLRTVPIPTGEQFLVFPSRNFGMGDVRIAVNDPLLDAFLNPALGGDGRRVHVVASPTYYGETNGAVGGRSLPVALLVPGERFHGAAAFALQQLNGRRQGGWGWGWGLPDAGSNILDNSHSNVYAFASLGMRFNDGRSSIGVSGYRAELDAIDGVNMLYGRSVAIEQSGGMTELRFGASHVFEGDRRVDAVIMNNGIDMTHNVHYADWTPADPVQWQQPWTVRRWTELNEDRTITWGMSARYSQPFVDEGGRIGVFFAANTKDHPKIPNYNIVDVPRDPGNSAAFNIGVGVSNRNGPALFAMDVVYEPAKSHTWAYADTAMAVPGGGTIVAGGKTLDNQFRFSNWHTALGLEREGDRYGFQLGLRLRQFRYSLDQENFMEATRRKTRESWMEWTPSWAASVRFPEFSLRYAGRFTARGWSPTDRIFWGGVISLDSASPGGNDFLIGPTRPVDMPAFRVTTHRLTLAVPFGDAPPGPRADAGEGGRR